MINETKSTLYNESEIDRVHCFFPRRLDGAQRGLAFSKTYRQKEPQSLLSFEDEKGAMWSMKELEKLNEELRLEPDQPEF